MSKTVVHVKLGAACKAKEIVLGTNSTSIYYFDRNL